MEIEFDPSIGPLSAIPSDDWKEEDTLRKVRGLDIPSIPSSSDTIIQPSLEDQLNAMELPEEGPNYTIRLQELVAKILAQYQQTSEKDKLKIEKIEQEYKNKTLTAADLQRELGWTGLKVAAFAFAASFLQFASPHESDRIVANKFAEFCPKFGDLWTSDLNAKLTSSSNVCQMLLNRYNLLSSSEQSKSGDKQQVSAVFEKAMRAMEAAARAG